ncbi:MAG TPA: sugar nucleotide-binding protein, partial [Burkholderiales bacterium]
LVAGLGIRKVRYPVLWETAQRGSGDDFDFTWAAKRLRRLRELGIEPIAGLLHHGSGPSTTSLVDPQFPEKLARYARAVAETFPELRDYTPVNEPLTTARFSGLYGVWYPHGKDNCTFLRALVNECRGTVLAMREIRAVNPEARLIQTDDLGRAAATTPCQAQARFENERRWLAFDLLFGHVGNSHPLWDWVLANGVEQHELEWFLENTCAPDIVGINHYPLSNRFLDHRIGLYPERFHCFREAEPYADLGVPQAREYLCADPLRPRFVLPEEILREVCARYTCPVAVTEVHIDGPRERQIQWLNEVWRAAVRVRDQGGNVCAVTVWSLLGSFDWNSLCSICDMYYEPGVFDIRGSEPRPTAIADVARALATEGSCEHPLAIRPGWWHEERAAASGPQLLIIGQGRLGQAFARVAQQRGLDYQLLTRKEVDIASLEQVRHALRMTRPFAVVNAAGFARVNAAEVNREQAFRDNAEGGEILASECEKHGLPLLAFSSHLVFNGDKAGTMSPYLEHDEPHPLNVYGLTKTE